MNILIDCTGHQNVSGFNHPFRGAWRYMLNIGKVLRDLGHNIIGIMDSGIEIEEVISFRLLEQIDFNQFDLLIAFERRFFREDYPLPIYGVVLCHMPESIKHLKRIITYVELADDIHTKITFLPYFLVDNVASVIKENLVISSISEDLDISAQAIITLLERFAYISGYVCEVYFRNGIELLKSTVVKTNHFVRHAQFLERLSRAKIFVSNVADSYLDYIAVMEAIAAGCRIVHPPFRAHNNSEEDDAVASMFCDLQSLGGNKSRDLFLGTEEIAKQVLREMLEEDFDGS